VKVKIITSRSDYELENDVNSKIQSLLNLKYIILDIKYSVSNNNRKEFSAMIIYSTPDFQRDQQINSLLD
jgi:hypothetical protein